MKIRDRIKLPVSPFFRKVRKVGLLLTAVGGVIVASPFALSEVLVSAGEYLLVAGTVLVAVSQVTVPEAEPVD